MSFDEIFDLIELECIFIFYNMLYRYVCGDDDDDDDDDGGDCDDGYDHHDADATYGVHLALWSQNPTYNTDELEDDSSGVDAISLDGLLKLT